MARAYLRLYVGSYHIFILPFAALILFVFNDTYLHDVARFYGASYMGALLLGFYLGVLCLALELLCYHHTYRFVMGALLILMSILRYYIDTLHVGLSSYVMQSVLSTDPRQVAASLNTGLALSVLIYAILPILCALIIARIYSRVLRARTRRSILAKTTPSRTDKGQKELKSLLSTLALRHTALHRWLVLKLLILLILLLLLGLMYMGGAYKGLFYMLKTDGTLEDHLNPTSLFRSTAIAIKRMRLRDTSYHEVGADAALRAGHRPAIVVLIIGESARAQNFSLNGYARATNPALHALQEESASSLGGGGYVVSFKDFSSCGVITAISVPCMLGPMTRANYKGRYLGTRSDSILDVAARAGYAVYYVSNNGGECAGDICAHTRHVKYYGYDDDFVMLEDLKSLLASAKEARALGGGGKGVEIKMDSTLGGGKGVEIKVDSTTENGKGVEIKIDSTPLPPSPAPKKSLKEPLEEEARLAKVGAFVVLHMVGSHGPDYYARHTEGYSAFMPECRSKDLPSCKTQEIINAYDNSILYTDAFLASVIEALQGVVGYDTLMWYVSDHGESLGEGASYMHGTLPYALAPLHEKRVASIMYLGEGYKGRYALLKSLESTPLSHDSVFHTLLDALGIETRQYDGKLDLLK